MAKDRSITLTVSEAQYDHWKRTADELDETMSAFIRRCVSVYLSAYDKKKARKNK